MYRHVPPIVAQDREQNHCWAAALVSWLQVTAGRPNKTLVELIDQYSDLDDGGISEKQFYNVVMDDFRMRCQRTEGLLNSGFYEEKLKLGHIVLIYKSGMQSAHTLVVYGIGRSGKIPMISYMDPWFGSYRYETLKWFDQRKKLAAWPV